MHMERKKKVEEKHYCLLRVEKLSSFAEVLAAYNHNYRTNDSIQNANQTKKHLNRELIEEYNQDESYDKVIRKKICELQRKKKNKVFRKNSFPAYEIVTTFTGAKGKVINLDEWAKDNVEWMKQQFNVPGQSNVISMMLHLDEEGAPHIHTIITPIDESGKYNGSRFLKNKYSFYNMQNSYADKMKKYGLHRGLKNSVAKHTEIKKFYTKLTQVTRDNLPEPELTEPIAEYYARANNYYKNEQMKNFQKIEKLERENIECRTNIFNLNKLLEAAKKKLKRLGFVLADEVLLSNNTTSEIINTVREANYLKKAIEIYPDRKRAEKIKKNNDYIINWYKEEIELAFNDISQKLDEDTKNAESHYDDFSR